MARCDSYYLGQCVWGVCTELGWVPDGLGNATDWTVNAALAGLQETMVPTVGAVVIYQGGDGYSPEGHNGIVKEVYGFNSFLVREMNFAAWNQWDERVSSMYDVATFILPPGVRPGQGGPPLGQGGPAESAVFAAQVINAWEYHRDYWNSAWENDSRRLENAVVTAGRIG